MACVRYRRNRWIVDFYDSTGRRRCKTCPTKEQAERECGLIMAGDREPSGFVTVADFFGLWSKHLAMKVSRSTYQTYSWAFEKHILPVFGGTNLRDIKRGKVDDFLMEKREAGLSINTVQIILGAFRAMLQKAVTKEYLVANPVLGLGREIAPPRKKGRPKVTKAMRPEELNRFLEAAEEEGELYHALFFTLARTGMRIGEAIALEITDLNLDAREVSISRAYYNGVVGETKTGETRVVDLSRQTSVILHSLLARRREEYFALGKSVPKLLFPSSTSTDGYVSYDAAREAFIRIRKRAGLAEHFTIHSLRHSFASILLSEGVPINYVQNMLGHASIQMTVDRYGSWIPKANKEAVDKLDMLGIVQ